MRSQFAALLREGVHLIACLMMGWGEGLDGESLEVSGAGFGEFRCEGWCEQSAGFCACAAVVRAACEYWLMGGRADVDP